MRTIRLATAADAHLVEALRFHGYQSSKDFGMKASVGPQTLKWGEGDTASSVLVVFDGSEAIATMRAEPILSWADASLAFDGHMLPLSHQSWPTITLSRAATVSDERGRGLNSIMRYHLINAAIKAGLPRVYGYIALGAARTHLMREMGYQFLEQGPHSYLPGERSWAIAFLDLEPDGEQALMTLFPHIEKALSEISWVGESIDFSALQPQRLKMGIRRSLKL